MSADGPFDFSGFTARAIEILESCDALSLTAGDHCIPCMDLGDFSELEREETETGEYLVVCRQCGWSCAE